jgi:hypothetical protein
MKMAITLFFSQRNYMTVVPVFFFFSVFLDQNQHQTELFRNSEECQGNIIETIKQEMLASI